MEFSVAETVAQAAWAYGTTRIKQLMLWSLSRS